jgi:hypothetical protein
MKTFLRSMFFLLAAFWCQACFDKPDKDCAALKAYKKNNQLVRTFANKSVFRRGDMIMFDVYKNQRKNNFVFLMEKTEKNDCSSVEFIQDSLEFKPLLDTDFVISDELDDSKVKNLIEIYASGLIAKMNSFDMREFTSEFSVFGIDLEFYFKDSSRLIYVSNLERIINPEWRRFINEANKIDQNWYHCPPD